MESMKKVAIYARVSSERQDVDLSISAQLKALREHAARNGQAVAWEYIDEAESGRSIDRPGFKEMIVAARQKPSPFDAILVWKLSRFARNREDSIVYKSLLRKHGVQVVSINEPVEDTPSGRLLEGIIEVIDEFYSANLAQDVVRGMRGSASRGYYPGGTVPFGYRRVSVKDGDRMRTKLEPDSATAPVVGRIFKEGLAGKGLKEIAVGLNKDGLTTSTGKQWGTTSVHNVLRNEVYAGTLLWDRRRQRRRFGHDGASAVRIDGAWPEIVGRGTFQEVQRKLASRAPKMAHPRTVHSQYLLSGMIRCKSCGASMIGLAAKSSRFFYYVCGSARRKGRGVCGTPLLPKERVETFVVDRLKQNILTTENLEDLIRLTNEDLAASSRDTEERLQALGAQLDDVENRLGKLCDALETGTFRPEQLAPRITALCQKKESLGRARAEVEEALRQQVLELADPKVITSYVQDVRNLLGESSIMEQKAFLKSFIRSIEVDGKHLALNYTIPLVTAPHPGQLTEAVPVLPIIRNGSPTRIRT